MMEIRTPAWTTVIQNKGQKVQNMTFCIGLSRNVFLKHVSKSIVRYVKTIFTKLERLDYILAILLKVSIEKSLTQTELSELFQTMIFPFYRL